MRLCFVAIAMLVSSVLVRSGPAALAQESNPLIGTWVLNVAKSQWGTAKPPKSQIRTFDYTRDGLIICTWRNVSESGSRGFVHWFTKLDGEHLPEFSRGSQHSDRTISVKKTGDYTYDIEGRLIEGKKVTFTGKVEITKDGKTMNWKVDDRRDNNTTLRVYEKE